MALIVKYKFQNVDANGNSVTLLPQFPSDVSYTTTDVIEGNITTRTIETDDLSKVTYIRFGCNESAYVAGAWEYLTEILDINISYVNTFYRMFRGCKLLNKIDVSNWDTSNVENMNSMFNGCSQLTQLDVSNWDTSKAQYMNSMFNGCSQLTQLDISNWDTSKVINMGYMFYTCSQLTQLDVSNWDTGNVTDMSWMFHTCSQLAQLDVSNWDTSNVTNMSAMFHTCSKLTQLDVSKWVTSNVTNMSYMFHTCSQLAQLDVSNWDTSNVKDMSHIFRNCSQLTQLNVSNWNTSNVTKMTNMFHTCSKLTQLDVSNWDTSKVTDMGSMFQNCSQLAQLDVSNWNTSKVISMDSIFRGCSQLTQIDISNWNTSNVTKMTNMFYDCSQLTQLDVSNWDTSKVTHMSNIFQNSKVEHIGLIYCSEDTINKLANLITSPCNFYVTNKTYTSPNPLVKYVMYREDKKQLLYYDQETQTWEKPVLRQWDSIEKHSDGKYYYHKRSGEVVLNGSEDWGLNGNNTIVYNSKKLPNVKAPINNSLNSYISFVCDRLIPTNIDNIYNNTSINGIAISKDSNVGISANGRDLDTFKQWLQANPTTVVYQLAEEKVYECANIDLITYQNETTLMVESGGILPKTTLKNHKNITNITTILQDKVNVLENNVGHVTEIFVDSKIEPINSEIDNINTDLIGVSERIEGSWISVDSKDGYLKDIEIIGNTIQDASNLADIRSVGDKVEGQELYKIDVVSRGKNLINPKEFGSVNSYGYCTIDIKVKSSTEYRFTHIDNVVNGSILDVLQLNAKNETISSYQGMWHGSFLTTSANTVKVRLKTHKDKINKVKMCEGRELCYEPYQEDKLTILSPVQLEKVGGVADRIICKDGVWGVEKNVENLVLDGSESWTLSTNADNAVRFVLNDLTNIKYSELIATIPTYMDVTNFTPSLIEFGISSRNNNSGFNFHIEKTKLNTVDLKGFKEWLKTNPVTVKYQLAEPQFIPLPHDQQIKLRTFAGQTNIHFETEIEGTIKAQVSKSLGATVNTHTEQIGNLSKELDRVKKLEESTTSTVTTDKDFITVEETSNGYFEDVKLEGRTLVNHMRNWKAKSGTLPTIINGSFTNDFATNMAVMYCEIKTGISTFICDVETADDRGLVISIFSNVGDIGASNVFLMRFTVNNNCIQKLDIPSDAKYLVIQRRDADTGIATVKNLMLLEGDHTQNPPEYFEGLKSVGQDVEEITVLSANDNLVDYLDKSTLINNGVIVGDYLKQTKANLTASARYNVVKGKEYTFAFDIYSDVPASNLSYSVTYDTHYRDSSNSKHIYMGTGSINKRIVINFTAKEEYVNLILGTSLNVTVKNVSLNLGNTDGAYTLPKRDKKQILYYNNETQTWEKPILRQWDSIEKHSDGKYYYHKRSGEICINNIIASKITDEGVVITHRRFKYMFNANILINSININNKYSAIYTDAQLTEGNDFYVRVAPNIVWIYAKNTALTTENMVEHFNGLTVVYQLAEEKVYECTDLDLITYQNETNLLIISGALNPKASLKVSKGVGNTVKMLQNKVTMLEQMVYNLMKMLNTQQSNIDE